MPTNLPPEAVEAERRYRTARSPDEKIATLEEFLRLIPKHKGTDHLRADLRRRLSRLKSRTEGRKGASRQASAYHIDREGAGQVVIVGPPNVGKSALVAMLTNATPEVSPAPFTTWQPTPGMMPVEDIQIQLIDTPPLTWDYVEPDMLDLIRRADLVLLVVDLQTYPVQQLEDTVAILAEHGIVPSHWRERYDEGQGTVFRPLLVLANKNDDASTDELVEIFLELLEDEWPVIPVSATTGRRLERLKRRIFEQLEIIRVYSKPPGEEPDLRVPFILKKGSTIEELAGKVHKDFLENLKAARVWGSGVFEGQMVTRDHVLHDGDVVELRI